MKKFEENKIYEIEDYFGDRVVAIYIGKVEGFSCCVCGKGNNAYCFNVASTIEELELGQYETWGFGKEHLPSVIRVIE